MRIWYEATLDDFVDVNLRQLRRSRIARGRRWQSAIASGLLTGLFVFAMIPESILVKTAWGVVATLVGLVLSPVLYQWTLRRRLLRYLKEQLGTEGPIGITVELTPEGLWTDQKGTQLTFAWPTVETIDEMPDCVEFLMRNGGILVVRRRAFESTDQLQRFLELARQYRDRSKDSTVA